jgi:uncharacterized protein (DUF58 family)
LHDDVRHIDWNVTARLQQPYVRQFTEDRDLTAWFLLDLSGSVDFGSADVTKLAVTAGFVATLARVMTRHGNRVGALLYGTRSTPCCRPRTSRLHVLNLLQRMRKPRGTRRRHGGTVLADLLQAADGIVKRRSLVFVVSDFISARLAGSAGAAGSPARGGGGACVRPAGDGTARRRPGDGGRRRDR